MSTTPVFIATPKFGVQQILPADTTTAKTLVTAGASGSKVTAVMAASDDSAARIVAIGITRSAVFYQLGAISVPALSGTDGTAVAVNLLDAAKIPGLPVDSDGQRYLLLESGDTLQAKTTTTVTTAKTIHLTSVFGSF